MPLRICYCFVALFVLTNAQRPGLWSAVRDRETSYSLIDIDLYSTLDHGEWSESELASGSGSGDDLMGETDDEDLLTGASGSGSGGASVPEFTGTTTEKFTTTRATPKPTTTTTTTTAPRTPCEQLREASKHLLGNFVPRCTPNGDYLSRQCRGDPDTGTCWCADLGGREIPGTVRDMRDSQQEPPDCEKGTNLPSCIFQLVEHSRTHLLGSFRPTCTVTGDFESKQCTGSKCFCVNQTTGVKIIGTELPRQSVLVCDPDQRTTPDKGLRKDNGTQFTLHPPKATSTLRPEQEKTDPVDIPIGPDKDHSEEEEQEEPTETNETGDSGPMREPSSAAHVMTQPGILAAIIGGSVVFLLCAVLLIMFIVYRMRKKDEGSYALDEPKKMPNYSYQRAPDREFYA